MDYARTSRPALLAAVMAVVAVTSACQSLTRGTSQDVAIETEPAGAEITLSDGQRCVSPCRLTMARYTVAEVTATKPGCRSAAGRLTSMVTEDATRFATIFDYQLGGAYDIAPNPLSLPLVCGEQARWSPPALTAEDEALLELFGQPSPKAAEEAAKTRRGPKAPARPIEPGKSPVW